MNKIFSNREPQSLDFELQEKICTYYFSVLWNRGSVCNLYMLNGQLPGGAWNQIITQMVTDSDGEITIKIGDFVQGTVINLIFGIQAITDLSKIVIVITNSTTNTSRKVLPKEPNETKSLEKGQTWNDKIFNYALH